MTRRARCIRTVAALAAAVWTLAPITPMGLCALTDALAATAPPAHCLDDGAGESAPATHECCKKVETSCCFEALASVATTPQVVEKVGGEHDDGLATTVQASVQRRLLPAPAFVRSVLGGPPGPASYLELQILRL